MEDKPEIKTAVHQMLYKNGFFRLPINSLSEILKLLEMEDAQEPKVILENTITGLLKVVQKYGFKFNEYLISPKQARINDETKSYVQILLQDTMAITNNKTPQSSAQQPSTMPIGMGSMSSMYSPYNPMAQYPTFYRPPSQVGDTSSMNDPTSHSKLVEQAMKLQQLYMYYSMYGYTPMMSQFGGGMNPYMHPYANFGQIPQGKQGMGQSPVIANNETLNQGFPMVQTSQSQSLIVPAPQNSQNNGNNAQLTKSKLQDQYQQMMNNRNSGQKQISSRQRQPQLKQKLVQGSQMAKSQSYPIGDSKRGNNKPGTNLEQKMTPEKASIQYPTALLDKNTEKQKGITKYPDPSLLKNCACKGSQKFVQAFLCSICNKTYHFYCLNEPIRKFETKEPIQCYHCRLRFIDPLNKVKDVIAEHYITNITENKFNIVCNMKIFQHLCKNNSKNEIEMRCLKVNHADNNEITWPDQCIIKLNGERIIEIPALQLNSSLKKRKDYSIQITQNIFNKSGQNCDKNFLQKIRLSLEIKSLPQSEADHKKIKNNYTFAFAIYFIEKLTVDQLYQKVMNQEKIPQVSNYIQKLMNTSEKEVQIDKISVTIKDPFTWDLIKTPVRGHKCHHGQCFDLNTFISFMSTAKNRTWKCPVCNKDARKFVIDSQQSQLIKSIQEKRQIPSEIIFLKNGTIVLKNQEREEEEDESKEVTSKTKKIIKSPKQERSRSEREPEQKSKQIKSLKQNDIEESKKQIPEIILDDSNDGLAPEVANPQNEKVVEQEDMGKEDKNEAQEDKKIQ